MALTVLVLVLGLDLDYGWAWASTDRSPLARTIVWQDSDVSDYRRFPARAVPTRPPVFRFRRAPGADRVPTVTVPVATAAEWSSGTWRGSCAPRARPRSWPSRATPWYRRPTSVATVTTRRSARSRWPSRSSRPWSGSLAQRHLLTMSSGLADLDLRAVALRDTRIAGPASRRFHYNNVNPILLGMVLERTAGRTVSAYLSQQLWGRWAWRPTVPGAWTAAGRAWSCCRPASTAGPSTSPSSAPCTSTGAPGGDGSSCRGVGWPSRPGSTAAPTPPPPSSSPHHNLVLVRLGTDYHYDHWPDPLATLARRLRT